MSSMHTVVFGWFGGSAIWFIPLLWRLVKTVLPGGAGVDDLVEKLSDTDGAGDARAVLLQIEVGSAVGAVGKGIADSPVAGEIGSEAGRGEKHQGKNTKTFHLFSPGGDYNKGSIGSKDLARAAFQIF